MKSTHILRKIYSSAQPISVHNCCVRSLKFQARFSASLNALKAGVPVVIRNVRFMCIGTNPSSSSHLEPMTKDHAKQLVMNLTAEERIILQSELEEVESHRTKAEFEGALAGTRFRSKYGRPAKIPTVGDVDPTGRYCHIPEDWLKKKNITSVPKPSRKVLSRLALTNAIPFIGFGFLDNVIMLVAGEHIESSLSVYITISTMFAAALGNTLSDIISIGSSLYVERGAAKLGLAPPPLSPMQLDMPIVRQYANMGRVLGITFGCFLGMFPLLLKDFDKDESKSKEKAK